MFIECIETKIGVWSYLVVNKMGMDIEMCFNLAYVVKRRL